jgi:hypothetical protein
MAQCRSLDRGGAPPELVSSRLDRRRAGSSPGNGRGQECRTLRGCDARLSGQWRTAGDRLERTRRRTLGFAVPGGSGRRQRLARSLYQPGRRRCRRGTNESSLARLQRLVHPIGSRPAARASLGGLRSAGQRGGLLRTELRQRDCRFRNCRWPVGDFARRRSPRLTGRGRRSRTPIVATDRGGRALLSRSRPMEVLSLAGAWSA